MILRVHEHRTGNINYHWAEYYQMVRKQNSMRGKIAEFIDNLLKKNRNK